MGASGGPLDSYQGPIRVGQGRFRIGNSRGVAHDGDMNDTTDTTEASQTSAQTARPPLRRSISDRKIAGVAGGMGRYFNIDPLIFRVVLVTLAVFGGSGLLLYAIGWLLVPEEGADETEAARLVNG